MKTRFRTIFKKLIFSELEPVFGCILFALISVVYFAFNQKVLGLSMPLSFAGYKAMEAVGINTPSLLENTQMGAKMAKSLFTDSGFILVIGFALGCTVVPLYRGEYHIKGIESNSQLLMMIIGGTLVGFGVQGVYGANIGEIYAAISMMSLSGWIIIPFTVLGLYIGRPVYERLAYYGYWTKILKQEKPKQAYTASAFKEVLLPKRLFD